MTKQQPSASSLQPSRLCRLLLIAFSLKLAVLGILIMEPVMSGGLMEVPGLSAFFGSSGTEALAATSPESVGAPPALPPSPAGQDPASAGTDPKEKKGLPALTGRDSLSPVPGASNGTAPADAQLRDSLTRRQEDLARKEQELRVLESELSSRLERMQLLENRLSSMIKDAEEQSDAKFRHLVDVLSNMKAKQAAAVLETLDPKIAVRVLAGMRGRQAGEILTFVRPEIAAKLTESLARMQLPLE